jgi:hypothetical protein
MEKKCVLCEQIPQGCLKRFLKKNRLVRTGGYNSLILLLLLLILIFLGVRKI